MKKIAVYPGSFDPFTKGHENIVLKALNLFDEVIIGVGINTNKSTLFTLDSRIKHISSLFNNNTQVRVASYQTLTTKFCNENNAKFILRGLRSAKDFDYEIPIAQTNKDLNPSIETVFLISDIQYNHLQSNIIREIFINGEVIDSFVTNSNILVKN
jgi:pantetheine-phosphate adenylyltransferase